MTQGRIAQRRIWKNYIINSRSNQPISGVQKATPKMLEFAAPEKSKVSELFSPTPVTIKDVTTKCGRTRVFWVRQELEKPPLVLLHGWGAGSGCFFKNIENMAPDRPVLLIDLPGFAESERIDFGEEDVEGVWLAALKSLIDAELGDGHFWLGGHSFGAYLAGLLAIENEININGVILMDAWGYAVMNETFEEKLAKLPWYGRAAYHVFLKNSKRTGLDMMRSFPKSIAQPMMKRARRDLTRKYGEFFMDYTFEINSIAPATGEIAFSSLMAGFGFAKNPMETRLLQNMTKLPNHVHFIYGGKSWVSSHSGTVIHNELTAATAKTSSVSIIDGASHHLMSTHPTEFNDIVNKILVD